MEDQTKKPPIISRVLAFLFATILVIALPLSLLAFDMWRVVFNPALVKELLTDEVVNSDLIPIALEWFSEEQAAIRVANGIALTGVDEPDIIILLSFMDRDDWRGIKAEVLTDEFLTNLVSVTVDETYAWIDSADQVPQITWDMRPFIARVDGDNGVNAIDIAYNNLPECTQEQIDDFTARQAAAPPNTEVLYNLCQFPDPWQEDQYSDYLNALFKVVENVPPEFGFTTELSETGDQGGVGATAIKNQLQSIRLFAQWAWLLPIMLALLIAALVVRSLRSLGRWEGTPFLIGGLLTLAIAFTMQSAIIGMLSVGLLSEVPDLVSQEVTRIMARIGGEVFRPMMMQAIVISIIGVALLVIGGRKADKDGQDAEPVTPES